MEHYQHYRYAAAESEYQKLLVYFPNDEILLTRIAYCQKPVFKPENMVLLQGGEYSMGDGKYTDNPKHRVKLADFYLNKFTVSNSEYAEFLNIYGQGTVRIGDKDQDMLDVYKLGLKKTGKLWQTATPGYENHPVVYVSWYGAIEFAKFWNMRLPTEAEWEFAARSRGKEYKYSWGNDEPKGIDSKKYGNIADISFSKKWNGFFEKDYDDGYADTAPVDSFEPNELGIYNMSGNVWEWCHDWYEANYYTQSPVDNPQGPESESGAGRVVRGGSWSIVAGNCLTARRSNRMPSSRGSNLGFRLCRTK